MNTTSLTIKICSTCETPYRMYIDLTISCPIGTHTLNKTVLRKKEIVTEGAIWDNARIYCNCGRIEFKDFENI